VILTGQQEMCWIFHLEYLLKLAFVVLDFCLVVHLYRANVVELNRKP